MEFPMPTCIQEEMGYETLKYIAGFISHKFHLPPGESNGSSWIDEKSNGKLIVPTTNLTKQCLELDVSFNKFHGDKISFEPNPIENFNKFAGLFHSSIDPKIIELFGRCRFYARLKQLNQELSKKKIVAEFTNN